LEHLSAAGLPNGNMVRSIRVASRIAALTLIVGCEINAHEKVLGPPITDPVVITITPASVVATAGQSVQFSVTTQPVVANPRWIWTSSDTSRVTVDSTGFARVVRTLPGGKVCAALSSNPAVSTCAQFVVPAR
jgi:hypothetical protein